MAASKYKTLDGVEVTAELKTREAFYISEEPGNEGNKVTYSESYYEIKFPEGEIRECHPSSFGADFKEVK